MTKQEEIREELARRIAIRDDKGFLNHNTLKYKITDEQYEFTDRILQGLHSQGAMLKVKCPDCEWSQFVGEESVGMTPCHSCNSTGYLIEPLVKEIKDG